jgi:hypothetical protein
MGDVVWAIQVERRRCGLASRRDEESVRVMERMRE